MEIQSYKCPNCGGGLVFDPKTQKFKCEYCLSAFTEETLKEMEEAGMTIVRDVEVEAGWNAGSGKDREPEAGGV